MKKKLEKDKMIPAKASNQMIDKIDQAIRYEIEDKLEVVRKLR